MLKFRIYDKEKGKYLDELPQRREGFAVTQAVTTDGALMEFWFTGNLTEAVPHVAGLPSGRYEIREVSV